LNGYTSFFARAEAKQSTEKYGLQTEEAGSKKDQQKVKDNGKLEKYNPPFIAERIY